MTEQTNLTKDQVFTIAEELFKHELGDVEFMVNDTKSGAMVWDGDNQLFKVSIREDVAPDHSFAKSFKVSFKVGHYNDLRIRSDYALRTRTVVLVAEGKSARTEADVRERFGRTIPKLVSDTQDAVEKTMGFEKKVRSKDAYRRQCIHAAINSNSHYSYDDSTDVLTYRGVRVSFNVDDDGYVSATIDLGLLTSSQVSLSKYAKVVDYVKFDGHL